MSSLLILAAGTLIILLFSLLVIYNFIRYRFKGDKTILFLVLFAILFILVIITTASLINYTPALAVH